MVRSGGRVSRGADRFESNFGAFIAEHWQEIESAEHSSAPESVTAAMEAVAEAVRVRQEG